MSRTPARKPAAGKRKPSTKKKKALPKKAAVARKRTSVEPPQAPPVELSPTPGTAPSNGLAVASLITGIAGFSFVPVVGGIVATLLGALALRREREDPERYTGRGIAIAGMIMGTLNGVVPLLVLTLFVSDDWTPIPFVAVASYAVFVFYTAMRGSTRRQKLAVFGGSIVATVLAIALAIGLAYLMVWAITALFTEALSSIEDAFGEAFEGLGDAFGSCGDAFN